MVLDPSDPLLVAGKYGPAPRVQSQAVTGKVWTEVGALTAARAGAAVLVRGRVHAVRGKGKSAFLVLREKGCTVQVRPAAARPPSLPDKTKKKTKKALAAPGGRVFGRGELDFAGGRECHCSCSRDAGRRWALQGTGRQRRRLRSRRGVPERQDEEEGGALAAPGGRVLPGESRSCGFCLGGGSSSSLFGRWDSSSLPGVRAVFSGTGGFSSHIGWCRSPTGRRLRVPDVYDPAIPDLGTEAQNPPQQRGVVVPSSSARRRRPGRGGKREARARGRARPRRGLRGVGGARGG